MSDLLAPTPENTAPDFIDPRLLELADRLDVDVPRGEARRRLAEVAKALVTRAAPDDLRAALAAAAETLRDGGARELAGALPEGTTAEAAELAVAFRAALPYLAREEVVRESLAAVEPRFAEFDEIDRAEYGPLLARAAVPALALDVELMKEEGYGFVASYPSVGSENVDVAGRAAAWLTRRMTLDGDAPRLVMRRFLALLAEEIEVELPACASVLDEVLAEPMPEDPPQDRPFLALAGGIVAEVLSERGHPW